MKIKGVDMSDLTKRHMEYMRNSMKRGATFTQAHKRAQKAVGK